MQTFTIGRNATNTIVLDDAMVSRQHAQLTILDNGQILIKDMGSSNGTYVNGNKVSESYLKAGDVVKCGSTFINWSQYVVRKPHLAPQAENIQYQHGSISHESAQEHGESFQGKSFSLHKTFTYLTTKVLESGDLLKADWNRTSSCWFYSFIPWGLSLLTLLYFYSENQFHFLYQVFWPLLLIILVFGVSQFLTLTLLSISMDTNVIKNIFASSIFSFIQFFNLVLLLGFSYIISTQFDHRITNESLIGYGILGLVLFTIAICMSISVIIFLYQYFRAIGASASASIYLLAFSFSLNFFFQSAFIYIFVSTLLKNIKFPF